MQLLKLAQVLNGKVVSYLGEENVEGIVLKDDEKIMVDGLFLSIGQVPNSEFLKDYPNSPKDRLAFIQLKRPTVDKLGPNEEYELKTSTFEALPYAFKEFVDNPEEYYHLLGLINNERKWRYTLRKYIDN